MAKTPGSGLFAALTDDETWILATKLSAGAAAAAHGIGDYALSMEIHDATLDVQSNWKNNK